MLIFEFFFLLRFECLFNKLKIQIVVTLVFDISIFNDVKSVCVCACEFCFVVLFFFCLFDYKFAFSFSFGRDER